MSGLLLKETLEPGRVRDLRPLRQGEHARFERSIPDVFAEQVALRGEAPAIVSPAGVVTFLELEHRSDATGGALRARLGSGSQPVAVMLTDLVELVTALLGVIRAGRPVLPIDSRAPAALVETLLRRTQAPVLIARAEHDAPWSPPRLDPRELYRSHALGPALAIPPHSDALVLYTSGSTGEPKLLGRPHAMVLHHALISAERLAIEPSTRVGLLVSPGLGTAYAVIFGALFSGATLLHYPTPDLGTLAVARWLTDNEVHVTSLVPSMIETVLAGTRDIGLPTLRCVTLGSEKATREQAEALRRALPAGARLEYTYGSTEAGRICANEMAGPIPLKGSPLPVGWAIPGQCVRVLDERGAPVQPFQTGEVVVSGPYLAHPWTPSGPPSDGIAERELHTRDLGYLDGEGKLVLTGRADRMVKIRGYRVELDAVERACTDLPGVSRAAVIDEPGNRGVRRMAAFVVADGPGVALRAGEMRTALRRRLPGYMLPSRIEIVGRLPLLPNGKLDLRALPAVAVSKQPVGTDTEELLAEIWADALKLDLESVGADSDYLSIGGDSLTAAIIAAEVQAAFGVTLELRAFAEGPTLRELAAHIDARRSEGSTDPRPAPGPRASARTAPLSWGQESTYLDEMSAPSERAYVVVAVWRLLGALDRERLIGALEHVMHRHEALRTVVEGRNGTPLAVVQPPSPLDVPFADLRDEMDPARAVEAELAEAERDHFDLARGPLMRFRLLRTSDREHRLIRLNHHIITDGWSSRVMLDELIRLYADREAASRLPPTLQSGDYSEWERSWAHLEFPFVRDEVEWSRRRLQTERPQALSLPFASPPANVHREASDGVIRWGVSATLAEEINKIGRAAGASFFTTRLACVAATLARASGRRDLVIHTYVNNRRRVEFQATVGFLSNVVPLHIRYRPEVGFGEWLGDVREAVLLASEHSEVPYRLLCAGLREHGVEPVEPRVIFHANSSPSWQLDDCELLPEPSRIPIMPWGMQFIVDRDHEANRCSTLFNANLYPRADILALQNAHARLLEAIAAQPDRPLGDI